jgi:hypothetical protein
MPHPVHPTQSRPRWWPAIPEVCLPGEGMSYFWTGAALADVARLGERQPGPLRSTWPVICGNIGLAMGGAACTRFVPDRRRTSLNADSPCAHLPGSVAACRAHAATCRWGATRADSWRWLRLLCLDGPLAKAEPKTLRYRLLHTAVRLVHGQRKRKIEIPKTWPWARQLEACFLAVFALVPP